MRKATVVVIAAIVAIGVFASSAQADELRFLSNPAWIRQRSKYQSIPVARYVAKKQEILVQFSAPVHLLKHLGGWKMFLAPTTW